MKYHSLETRAAVMSCLLQGQGVGELAKEYNLPTSTISRWKKEATGGVTEDVGELLLAYLQENLTTLREQAIVFRDVEWLKGQDASSLGVLHGILTDKAVRLLESLSGGPLQ